MHTVPSSADCLGRPCAPLSLSLSLSLPLSYVAILALLTAFLGGQAVQTVVALALITHEAAEGEVRVASDDHLAVLIHIRHGDLHRAVVLGLDQTAGGRTLARDVQVDEIALGHENG